MIERRSPIPAKPAKLPKVGPAVSPKGFSEATKAAAYQRANAKCECTRLCPDHAGHRCSAPLVDWHPHHKAVVSSKAYNSLDNCEALCARCHKNVGTLPK